MYIESQHYKHAITMHHLPGLADRHICKAARAHAIGAVNLCRNAGFDDCLLDQAWASHRETRSICLQWCALRQGWAGWAVYGVEIWQCEGGRHEGWLKRGVLGV